MTRKTALDLIRIDVAQNGRLTQYGMRLYIENRISRTVLNDTIRVGMSQYRALQARKEEAA